MTRVLYAKSAAPGHDREPLVDHLLATRDAVRTLRNRLGTVAAGSVVPGGFWAAVEVAALCHDLGKVAVGFQDMLTGRTRGWEQRHELLSLGFLPTLVPGDDQRLWAASAVITHHRPLAGADNSLVSRYAGLEVDDLAAELGQVADGAVDQLHTWASGQLGLAARRPPTGAEVVAYAHRLFYEVSTWWHDPVDPRTGLAAVLIQGALTLADHLSSAHGSLHLSQPLDETLPARLADHLGGADRIHPHQRRCGGVSGHLLLRSPTGSGKTEGGLLWAANQVVSIGAATGGVPRVFHTLPYLASVNAMARRLGGFLGDPELVGVAHSRAASYHLANATSTDDGPAPGDARAAASKAVSRSAATRLFQETVRVTTPYQLLRAALAGPAHSGILVDTANSVVVLDELHAYDATRLGYILASAALWERLGCRIAVLSATLPAALAGAFDNTLTGRVTTVVGPPGPPRHRIRLRDHALTDAASLAEITAELKADRSVLVVANNVAHAQVLFDALAPVARGRHGADAAILLHSRFKRRDRNAAEAILTERYGTCVPQRRPGLVVATQVVEVSLDLDLDLLHTAGAPLEALLQRFGRVNRGGRRPPADVVICQPGYGPRRRASPELCYADGVYEAEPVQLGMEILARHEGQPVDESEATGWLDEVYASPWGARWRAEVDRVRAEFDRCFLRFERPFDGREELAETFDRLFDGTEAILSEDRDAYAERLGLMGNTRTRATAAGRLLGEELLIPLPGWATGVASYDKRLRVRVIEGDYDRNRGLLAVRPVRGAVVYEPGEVL